MHGAIRYIISYNQIVTLRALMRNFFISSVIGCQIINVKLSAWDPVDDILPADMFLKILTLFD